MELINKDSILKEIPLFAALTDEERNIIKERSGFLEYKKGQIIYEENSDADAFYCVVLGRVMIYTKGESGDETTLEYLHRGKYFGIISLLTGDTHSVTARAINDSTLLVIKKADFDFVLTRVPKLAIDLSQVLSRRLKNKDLHQKTIFETTVISVFSSYSPVGKTSYALNLALSLQKETQKKVAVLEITLFDKMHSLLQRLEIKGEYKTIDLCSPLTEPQKIIGDATLKDNFGIDLICLQHKPENEDCLKRLVGILSLLLNDYNYIILDLPSLMEPSVFAILNQSDLIHILTSPEPVDLKRTRSLIERLKTDFRFEDSKIKVIINEYKLAKLSYEEQSEVLGYPIFATLPKIGLESSDRFVLDAADCEYAKVIRRISRQVGDCIVGLALGVGVAYGFCHLGVLKVIEEEKIPIDIISGSSVGAFIASLWAIGKSSQEILEIFKEFKEARYAWELVDLTFSLRGFMKGNKVYRFLKRHLGDKTFYDVKLPLKIVATDVKRKESRVLNKGFLVDAIMASCTMPGIFMPFQLREGMLFDGGVINPLPTEVLFNAGAKKIIAVNVTPSREDFLKEYEKLKESKVTVSSVISKKHSFFDFRRYLKNKLRLNILGIVFSSIEVMQSEIAKKEAQLADVVLHPDTSGLYWLELHKAKEFAKRGEEETRRNLAKIRQVINE